MVSTAVPAANASSRYASVSTDDAASARKFSILVTCPGAGSAVREADPPPR
jgi:hypothetical protein